MGVWMSPSVPTPTRQQAQFSRLLSKSNDQEATVQSLSQSRRDIVGGVQTKGRQQRFLAHEFGMPYPQQRWVSDMSPKQQGLEEGEAHHSPEHSGGS